MILLFLMFMIKSEPKYTSKHNIIIVAIIVVFSFILYGNTINNHYSLDDELVTNTNQTVKNGIKAIPEIFTTLYYSKCYRLSSFCQFVLSQPY